jgi:hypothetical protein
MKKADRGSLMVASAIGWEKKKKEREGERERYTIN